MVLIVLALIWAAVLLPPMIRNRVEGNAADSIGDFRNRLGVLRKTTPVAVQPAFRLQMPAVAGRSKGPVLNTDQSARRRESQRRRRDVLVSLGGAAIASLVLGLMFGPSFLMLNLLFDVLLAGYIVLLVRMRTAETERDMKLRYLPNQGYASSAPTYATSSNDGVVADIDAANIDAANADAAERQSAVN